MKDTLLFQNLTVLNEDLSPNPVPFLAVQDGVISYLGKNNPFPEETPCDLGGTFLAKCFCDYHYHLPGSRLYDLFGVNLTHLEPKDYESVLRDGCNRYEILRGFGWDVASLSEFFKKDSRRPLDFLDAISPTHPIFLFSMDFHSCWCNSASLALLQQKGITCEFIDSEIPHGEDCILHEKVAEQIFMCPDLSFSPEQIREAVLKEQEQLLSMGITEVFSLLFIGTPFYQMLDVLHGLEEEKLLLVKVHFSYTTSREEPLDELRKNIKKCLAYESDHLLFASVKVYIDGVIDNHSAFLQEVYSDRDTVGRAFFEREELALRTACAEEYGLPMHAHAIGDAAVALAAEVFSMFPSPSRGRHMIAHLQLCEEDTMKLMAKKDIIACLQPFWFFRGKRACRLDRDRLGDRIEAMYPAASLLRHGVKVLFSSDCPATAKGAPLKGMRIAEESDDGEAVSVAEGFRAYHVGAYRNESAAPAVGDAADFLLLSGNPKESKDVEVTAVYRHGILLWTKNKAAL